MHWIIKEETKVMWIPKCSFMLQPLHVVNTVQNTCTNVFLIHEHLQELMINLLSYFHLFFPIVSLHWQLQHWQSWLVFSTFASRGRSFHDITLFHEQRMSGCLSVSLSIVAFYLMSWQRLLRRQVFGVSHLYSIHSFFYIIIIIF